MNINNDRKTRLKSAAKVQQHKNNRKRWSTSSLDGRETETKLLSGDCPPFNDKASWISDPIEKRAYMIGGIRDKRHVPTDDFYYLDVTKMKWTNLTDGLRYRDISPFSVENCKHASRRIPKLSLPAYTILRLYATSFLLLFGGYDDESEQASSRLIVIDLHHLEWWYQPVQHGIVAGRIDPTMVAIDRKLYIFGGYRHFSENEEPHASYCIASLSDDGKDWSWEACDVPYPQNVPQGTVFTEAAAIYNGAKILLTPGRTTRHQRINFEEDSIYCFHIERRKFQLVDISGEFPKSIGWYFTFSTSIGVPPLQEVSNPHLRTSLSTRSLSYAPAASSSAVICGWMDWEDFLIPEVWHVELTPIERIRKLNIVPMVVQLDSHLESEADLQVAVMVGDQLFLLGSRRGDAGKDGQPLFNVYFEVPLRRLCSQNH